jgi:hypothetical protein
MCKRSRTGDQAGRPAKPSVAGLNMSRRCALPPARAALLSVVQRVTLGTSRARPPALAVLTAVSEQAAQVGSEVCRTGHRPRNEQAGAGELGQQPSADSSGHVVAGLTARMIAECMPGAASIVNVTDAHVRSPTAPAPAPPARRTL